MSNNSPSYRRHRRNSLNERKRGLPFPSLYLNKEFEGSVMHHLTQDTVIYVPRELHESIIHNVKTGEGMDEINKKCISWAYTKIGTITTEGVVYLLEQYGGYFEGDKNTIIIEEGEDKKCVQAEI